MNRVGHAFFKRRMREEDAIFGGEVTGHYYFRDNFYADNGFIPALLILELMSRKGQTLRELLAPLREKYFISGEINTKVADMQVSQEKIDGLSARYTGGRVYSLDGDLGGIPRLALQRPRLEHRADAAPQPRGDDAGDDGREARRGARVHQELRAGVPAAGAGSDLQVRRVVALGAGPTSRRESRCVSRRPDLQVGREICYDLSLRAGLA